MSTRRAIFSGLIIGVIALAARWPLAGPGLNYDELQSVTFAALAPADLIATLPKVDAHPPLYYLQLHYWPGLHLGDMALRWNSILWGLVAVALFGMATARLFGAARGWLAALLLAVNPLAVYYADAVRMYAMLTALAGCVFLGIAMLETAPTRRGEIAGALIAAISATLAGWCQGAGFLVAGSLVAYLLLRNAARFRSDFPSLVALGAALLGCAALVPWLLHARGVAVTHLYRPDLWHVAVSLKELLFGIGSWPRAAVYAAAGLLAAVCFLAARADWYARRLVISFILAPLLATGALSLAGHPIWDTRTFAWVAPFLAVAVSVALMPGYTTLSRRGLSLLIGLSLGAGTASGIAHPFTADFGYRECAHFLKAHAGAGDLIFAPKRDLWALGWYASGGEAIHPVKTSSLTGPPAITNRFDPKTITAKRLWLWHREGHRNDLGEAEPLLKSKRYALKKEYRFGRSHLMELERAPRE